MKILIDAGITLNHFLILAAILFTIGMCGIFINRKSIITILLSIELMLLAVNINFVAFSVYQGNILGQVFTIFILTVAAAESAVGLAIIVVYFRSCGNIDIDKVNTMKG
ncbi:NADH-quinone oxidoreductase subunit NuoK [Candidatus Neoehrlichia procyonis]|uniref:NADH-quinone oxidoreductase subunit K n=1 Tax=Candidatus Neoehrlichia procyonis str. RAC413 TaxID=1359163 RepID=A0A0F3NLK1_9RICK|nr:NADH-quinone oxidoreductase subunit NuoK [Candidatus Neoehrlichia lotoris]KJV68925.1 NADH-ubiquinone/plastoquinone oxidoreductase chain 4L family protein [Candidatus Neoehrlichia lotoris str. RAC413]